jgi:hypothetical protein
MDGMFALAKVYHPEISDDSLRSQIVSTNLKALVEIILMGDDPESPVTVNLKQLCLALLSTADWLYSEEVPPNVNSADAGLSEEGN